MDRAVDLPRSQGPTTKRSGAYVEEENAASGAKTKRGTLTSSGLGGKTLPAQPTAEYGAKLARSCVGCHGENFSGGPIPGAPAELPVPANLTPHESGLASISEADWNRILDTGIKRSGVPLNSFMPIEGLRAMNAAERGALYQFLRGLPPRPFGQR